MSYQVITDFRGGLDARKFRLSLPPGTLLELINGHITPGAEIEKRKAFGNIALPSDTFGAQESLAGIYIFGSRAKAWTGSAYEPLTGYLTIFLNDVGGKMPEIGDSITITGAVNAWANVTGVVSGTSGGGYQIAVPGMAAGAGYTIDNFAATLNIPTPAIYQQLTHPAGATMTAVTASCFYQGETYAMTTWSNGDQLLFKGSTLVPDYYVGKYGNLESTPYAMASDLCAQVVTNGQYTAKLSPPAALHFQITGGTSNPGVNQVTVLRYNFNRTVNLNLGGGLTAATYVDFLFSGLGVDWTTSNANTATAVASAVAILASYYGFSITASSNTVTLTPPATDYYGVALGTSDKDTITVTTTGDVTTYMPQRSASFDVFSVPSSSVPQFTVSKTVTDANLTFKLVNNGSQPTAPIGAVGQFIITAGGDNPHAVGQIAYTSSLPTDGSTITVGSVTYTFRTLLTGVLNQVKIGTTPNETLTNLVAAINNTSGAGTAYSAGTAINPDCSAIAVTSGHTVLTATLGGTVGNALALSQSGAFFTLTAFANGGPDANQVSTITVSGVDLLQGAAVPFQKDAATTAANVVAVINSNSGITNFSATNTGNVVSLVAVDPGATYNSAEVIVTTAGNVCIGDCSFQVGATADQTISSIKINGTTELLLGGTSITFQDATLSTETLSAFCGRVVTSINANTGTSGWLAYSSGVKINISQKVVSSSDVTPGVVVSGTASVVVGVPATISVQLTSPQYITWLAVKKGNYGSPTYQTSEVVFTVSGGVAPYTYKWAKLSGTADATAKVGTQSNSFYFYAGYTKPDAQSWQCTIADAAGNTVLSPVIWISIF